MRSFEVPYLFGGSIKRATLPEWLVDSRSDRFGGEIGLTQTTRVCVHQTKVRLLAAALDVFADRLDKISENEITPELVQRGLRACVDRHRDRWPDLTKNEVPVPTFEYAFALHAPDEREPAFLQCPHPGGPPFEVAEGVRLLPDLGFSVPAHVSVRDDAGLAFQLMANAGRLGYVKGKPTTSRPLGQAVAVDVPGRPAWRVRHEVGVLLDSVERLREGLGLKGGIVFAWLLPFHADGKPIPREEQHPLLLDVPAPVRVLEDRRIAVFNRPCKIGSGEGPALPAAALALRSWWAVSGMPGLATQSASEAKARKNDDDDRLTDADLREAGLDPKPEFVQRPLGRPVNSADLLALIQQSPKVGGNGEFCPLVLSDYANAGPEEIDAQDGAELVIEGEPIGNSTTGFWLDVRVPLPIRDDKDEPAGERWRGWQKAVEGQLEYRRKEVAKLSIAAKSAWLARRQPGNAKPSRQASTDAGTFARSWASAVEAQTDADLWAVAARTWHDQAANETEWRVIVNDAARQAARAAFDALGGFDDPATLMGASGLLRLIQGLTDRAA